MSRYGLKKKSSRRLRDFRRLAKVFSRKPAVEQLESRRVLSTITWVNRGDASDMFDTAFPNPEDADRARALVDAAIWNWEQVITDFKHDSATPGVPPDVALTVMMDAADNACSAFANGTFDATSGKPVSGTLEINFCDSQPDGTTDWWIDPTPLDHSEFMGDIRNAFAGRATPGGPADGMRDLLSLIVHEIGHVMGVSGDAMNRLQTGSFLTDTGVSDVGQNNAPADGNLWLFQGASINALMTEFDIGGSGPPPGHMARPQGGESANNGVSFGGVTVYGSTDIMIGTGITTDQRLLISNKTALLLRDAYGYEITLPETLATFYAVLDESTGELTVRGGSDATVIDGVAQGDDSDVITIVRDGDTIVVSVDVEHDVPGTGTGMNPNDQQDAFVTRFDAGRVTSITVNAGAGDDFITVGDDIGVPIVVNGEEGNDVIIGGDITINGGPGDDHIYGSSGDDILNGGPGDDRIYGLEGNDVIDGGDGNDTIFAGQGNDTINGGLGNDVIYAGEGNNSVTSVAGDGDDVYDFTDNSAAIGFISFGNDTVYGTAFDDGIMAGDSGNVVFEGRGGDDLLMGGDGADRLVGGAGNDIIHGEGGDDTILAGAGNDQINAGPGNDLILGGDGADINTWNHGDNDDIFDGGEGDDVQIINGAGDEIANDDGEIFDIRAAGVRVHLRRTNLVPFLIDMGTVEQITLNTGTSDNNMEQVTVHSLLGTDLQVLNIDAGADTGNALILNGTVASDTIDVGPHPTSTDDEQILGLGPVIHSIGFGGDDHLTINGLDGDDRIKANAGLDLSVTLNGNDGDDFLSGDVTINGGNGNDTLEGSLGDDTLNGGAGDDIFLIHSGNIGGTDVFVGGDGADTIVVTGTLDDDDIDITASTIVMNAVTNTIDTGGSNTVERLRVHADDGEDNIAITGNFAGINEFIVYAGDHDDVVSATVVSELEVHGGDGDDMITGGGGNDRLYGDGGADVLNGGSGNDDIWGGADNDLIIGGAGADNLYGGDDADLFIWNDGDGSDLVEGGAGNDVLRFNDAAAVGNFTLDDSGIATATGSRLHLQRAEGSVLLDIAAVEDVSIFSHGGSDTFQINDLTNTDLASLSLTFDDSDDASQTATVEGRATADDISIIAAGGVRVIGLAYEVAIFNSATDPDNDRLIVSGNEGDDRITAAPGVETLIGIQLDGDAGDDFLSANAILNGGDGNDTLIGGEGNDTYSGGAGDDTLIFSGGDDIIDGDEGFDTLLFVGSAAGEILSVTEADFVLTVQDGVPMTLGTVDLDNDNDLAVTVERLDFHAGDGDDVLNLTDLSVPVHVDGGDGNDQITLAGLTANATVVAGAGNDRIDGQAVADDNVQLTLLGGDGDDVLIGGDSPTGSAVGDRLEGGPGDDYLEGGRGRDSLFGGDGSDLFVWVAGDGTDLIEGGAGESDELQFIASDGVQRLELFGGGVFDDDVDGFFSASQLFDGSRAIFALNYGQIFLNLSDIEQIDVDALGGGDHIVVNNTVEPTTDFNGPTNVPASADEVSPGMDQINVGTDLRHTHIRSIDIDLGGTEAAATDLDMAADRVEIHGTLAPDDVYVSTQTSTGTGGETTSIDVAGFVYGLRIFRSEVGNDALFVHGQAGDDRIIAEDGVEMSIGLVLAGNEGSDFLTGAGLLLGGSGNDFLVGGGSDATLRGGSGEDTLIGGGGNDSIDGGSGFDTILVAGTSANDVIDVHQTSSTQLVHTVNGATETDTLVEGTVEHVLIDAGDGADFMRGRVNDGLFDDVGLSLRMTFLGGRDATRDQLIIVDDGGNDLTLYRKSQADNAGTVTIGPDNAEPFEHVFEDVERVLFLDQAGNAPNGTANDARLAVFKHDPFEFNDDRTVATHLGANGVINVDPTIDPGGTANPFGDGVDVPGDADWYRVEAEVSGTLDFQVFFEQIADADVGTGRNGLPGDGDLDIFVFDADGTPITGFGNNDSTDNERIRIPAVQGQIYYLAVRGATADAVNTYSITTINTAPTAPYDLELDDAVIDGTAPDGSDTGRSNHDNVTMDNTPTIYLRFDDGFLLQDLPGNATSDAPPDEVILIPFRTGDTQPTEPGFAIAIFDEGNTPGTGNSGVTAPQEPLGFAMATADAGVYVFTTPELNDGTHFLTARVQIIDPADPRQTGFGPRSASLEIIVDTVDPLGSFGEPGTAGDGLSVDSDTGVVTMPMTFEDRITSDTTPTFWGRAEANTIVRIYLDADADGMFDAGDDLLIGQTTAIPFDGNLQEPDGYWELTSEIEFNDPDIFMTPDGLRTLFLTTEDVAGNENMPDSADETLQMFIDTRGPRITAVQVNNTDTDDSNGGGYDLFNPKPTEDGPTPLVNSLVISVEDLPVRVTNFLYDALKEDVAEQAGHYRLVGDHNGIIPISGIDYQNVTLQNGSVATGTITLTFFEPLPDDRFTLTVSDSLVDPANNALDGESDAPEPQESPDFPTGDGVPAGQFVARFTVDSRAELAIWAAGSIYVDTNGNFVFDTEGKDNDTTNEDISYVLGFTSDNVFAGNFAALADDPDTPHDDTVADGFDKIAAYGFFGGGYRWLIDTNNDGVPDETPINPLNVDGLPAAGNFDGNAKNGDEIVLKSGNTWHIDTNRNFTIDAADDVFHGNMVGLPIVGDFDGDGTDDLGAWADDFFSLNLSSLGDIDGIEDIRFEFGFTGARERPIAADFDGDNIDDIGLWVPGRSGAVPVETAEWYILVSNGRSITARINDDSPNPDGGGNTVHFSPIPFGSDIHANYGDEFALPLAGNFDPPVAVASGEGGSSGQTDTNPVNPLDVNNDGRLTAADVIVIINTINESGLSVVAANNFDDNYFVDVNADGSVSALDSLLVINQLNQLGNGEGESGGEVGTADLRSGDAGHDGSPAAAMIDGIGKRAGLLLADPVSDSSGRLMADLEINPNRVEPTAGPDLPSPTVVKRAFSERPAGSRLDDSSRVEKSPEFRQLATEPAFDELLSTFAAEIDEIWNAD